MKQLKATIMKANMSDHTKQMYADEFSYEKDDIVPRLTTSMN